MANDTRIVLGKRGADYGCFISPPGKDVLTSVDGDLIFDSTPKGYPYELNSESHGK